MILVFFMMVNGIIDIILEIEGSGFGNEIVDIIIKIGGEICEVIVVLNFLV